MSSQPNKQSFTDTQYQFAGHIREPEHKPAPDNIEQRRMNIYRELFYNNIEGFVSNAFPVLRKLTADETWHAMIRDFMIKHHCKSPLFHEISREFLTYLEDERDLRNDPVFIKELAHYEWVELALSISDADVDELKLEQIQYPLNEKFNTSALAWPLVYHYPVHQIGPDFQPQEASDTPVFLLVYRSSDDRVTFMELNPVSARLIDLLNEGKTGQLAAELIAQELQHPNAQVVIDGATALLNDWLERGILVSAP